MRTFHPNAEQKKALVDLLVFLVTDHIGEDSKSFKTWKFMRELDGCNADICTFEFFKETVEQLCQSVLEKKEWDHSSNFICIARIATGGLQIEVTGQIDVYMNVASLQAELLFTTHHTTARYL